MCHGKTGDGKGDVAADMKLKMNDETNPATLKDRTDGELFYIIQKGKDQMPPEGSRVKDEAIWDMVNYVRFLAKKGDKPAATAAEAPAPEKAPN
jgi:mono/diheme cytochrome c family protein